VDTAALKNSIQVEDSNTTPTGAYVNIGSELIYANIQEFGGTIKAKNKPRLTWKDKNGNWHSALSVTLRAQPYMRPAVDNHESEIANVVGTTLKRIIEKVTT